ncbi:DUF7305 domain-containing protein [Sorangium sp. So ce131]|uniref:DUF7305 domain-containing protein n=1 Tax=Sorangium sp. So ce131 TaxID=3133282 RepID=UPI003F60B3EB
MRLPSSYLVATCIITSFSWAACTTSSGGEAGGAPGGAEGPGDLGDDGGPSVPVVQDGTTTHETCTGTLAEHTFGWALCSCEDTRVAGYLETDSFRSSRGPESRRGGAVGVNRDYSTAGYADVGGTFTVAGSRDVLFGGVLKVGGDLKFAPSFDVAGVTKVGRDAWLGDTAFAIGVVDIERDLHMPAGKGFRGVPLVNVGGTEHVEAVEIAPPCPCGADQILDVSAMVDDGRLHNDNAAVGLDPDALNVVAGLGVDIALPDGRYYVHQIGGLGAITLRVKGRVALFVGDDLWASGLFRVELDPGAELDLFIRDNLVIAGAAKFGDESRPAAMRIYAGGTGDIALAGYNAFAGNLYAPEANIAIGGVGVIYGSLFGKNIVAPGALIAHYDESILESGDDCDEPSTDGGCDESIECAGGQVCTEGSCGECTQDSDCAAPLVCQDGECTVLVTSDDLR